MEKKNIYVILPTCSDMNRGDQALAWETKRIAEDAGYIGDYYIMADKGLPTDQSEKEGLKVIYPILKHPSRFFRINNIQYSIGVKILWGAIAAVDYVMSKGILCLVRMGLKQLPGQDNRNTLHVIKKCDAVFVKGGGFIQSYTKSLAKWYSLYFQLYHIILAQKLGKKICVLPNSMGPFEGMRTKKLVKNVLENASIVMTRETISKNMIKNAFGLTIDNYPDLGFFLEGDPEEKKYMSVIDNLRKDRQIVALTVRPYRFPASKNPAKAYRNYQTSIIEFSKWLYRNGYCPIFIEQTRGGSAHESDIGCIRDIVNRLKKKEYILISDSKLSCRKIKKIYARCDYIIATRFHSLIFSLSEGVCGIAITYGGNKGKGIMEDIGLSDFSIEIEDLSFEELKSKFINMTENIEEYKVRVNKYMDYIYRKREEMVKLLREKT